MSVSITVSFGFYEIDVEVSEYIPASSGNCSRLPEDCEPAEEAQIDWELVDSEAIAFIEDEGTEEEFVEELIAELHRSDINFFPRVGMEG